MKLFFSRSTYSRIFAFVTTRVGELSISISVAFLSKFNLIPLLNAYCIYVDLGSYLFLSSIKRMCCPDFCITQRLFPGTLALD
ncbi:hypothetical protein GYMLUDRAFT_692009 [Collybiopsis luxurians FD-317 M1]|uniref:Uncharacterized protein n=1 Tax=Collybiopsis luxurians FD-317 M1 TaxID=944289 RepID=A0A0D0BT70_9AGAR|nr:hypothetical protein GYMLUDRAFT_692009 [Collybiopsis luxurians FD-317 M1]